MLCIARAYGDEPLRRIAVASGRGLTYVVNPSAYNATKGDDGSGVGFPSEAVFQFDADLFGRLRAAFDAGDRALLLDLWRSAVRLNLRALEVARP
ncbi:MAG: hypothetical protein FD124_530 [Alphaproteobacteria bacterium]|nr:MAG: hypothetical protein FD160_2154 [Caulobacteraceae bacterium]TPW08257.1 MAG: hypothetical protein FD124_530 [Alphaproteobacteria bacterium]